MHSKHNSKKDTDLFEGLISNLKKSNATKICDNSNLTKDQNSTNLRLRNRIAQLKQLRINDSRLSNELALRKAKIEAIESNILNIETELTHREKSYAKRQLGLHRVQKASGSILRKCKKLEATKKVEMKKYQVLLAENELVASDVTELSEKSFALTKELEQLEQQRENIYIDIELLKSKVTSETERTSMTEEKLLDLKEIYMAEESEKLLLESDISSLKNARKKLNTEKLNIRAKTKKLRDDVDRHRKAVDHLVYSKNESSDFRDEMIEMLFEIEKSKEIVNLQEYMLHKYTQLKNETNSSYHQKLAELEQLRSSMEKNTNQLIDLDLKINRQTLDSQNIEKQIFLKTGEYVSKEIEISSIRNTNLEDLNLMQKRLEKIYFSVDIYNQMTEKEIETLSPHLVTDLDTTLTNSLRQIERFTKSEMITVFVRLLGGQISIESQILGLNISLGEATTLITNFESVLKSEFQTDFRFSKKGMIESVVLKQEVGVGQPLECVISPH